MIIVMDDYNMPTDKCNTVASPVVYTENRDDVLFPKESKNKKTPRQLAWIFTKTSSSRLRRSLALF